jgi:hypothetical protein
VILFSGGFPILGLWGKSPQQQDRRGVQVSCFQLKEMMIQLGSHGLRITTEQPMCSALLTLRALSAAPWCGSLTSWCLHASVLLGHTK